MSTALVILVFLPFLAAPFVGNDDRAAPWLAGATALLGLAILSILGDAVFTGQVIIARWDWLPALGLQLSWRLDGLALLFALLILGIGLLIVPYSHFYLERKDRLCPCVTAAQQVYGARLA